MFLFLHLQDSHLIIKNLIELNLHLSFLSICHTILRILLIKLVQTKLSINYMAY